MVRLLLAPALRISVRQVSLSLSLAPWAQCLLVSMTWQTSSISQSDLLIDMSYW